MTMERHFSEIIHELIVDRGEEVRVTTDKREIQLVIAPKTEPYRIIVLGVPCGQKEEVKGGVCEFEASGKRCDLNDLAPCLFPEGDEKDYQKCWELHGIEWMKRRLQRTK